MNSQVVGKSMLLNDRIVHVNERSEFFRYEHFYVIYCNFYLLDKDEKNYLTPFDISLYSNSALTNLVVQRIFFRSYIVE
uniref:DUF223 domain-containing protein n=1 Tax=Elaeophora elaphi TaxID=1147741 RepID=A0A0R3RWQ0_9BILA